MERKPPLPPPRGSAKKPHLSNRRRRRALVTLLVVAVALGAPLAASADRGHGKRGEKRVYLPPSLAQSAADRPADTFEVIVQGAGADSRVREVEEKHRGKARGPKHRFAAVDAVAIDLTGAEIEELAATDGIEAITPDAPVILTGAAKDPRNKTLWNVQQWPYVSGVAKFWKGKAAAPAIAIVDSGIDASRPDVAGRVVHQVVIGAPGPNAPGDGRGHGTFVASLAAGAAPGYAGAAPTAPLVSIDVVDDNGRARTSDVIAAADWILANKDRFNIRVANFSLHSSVPASFLYDPLDKAVERLWFAGVVVVAAAGNYAEGGAPSGVRYAPANDPFVITVGAADTKPTLDGADDFAAPWSAYGYTYDGFAKPEIAAPGRFLVAAVSPASTLALANPCGANPDYIRLSGTSFAAPIVAGAAADILAVRPSWTPDQVKGALMVTASPMPAAAPLSTGMGMIKAHRMLDIRTPPAANAALAPFVVSASAGAGRVLDAASWTSAAQANPAWAAASWTSASWSSASWTSASWSSASWTSASWTSASWTTASWTSASTIANSASDEVAGCAGYAISPSELVSVSSELDLGDLPADVGQPAATVTAPVSTAALPAPAAPTATSKKASSSGGALAGAQAGSKAKKRP